MLACQSYEALYCTTTKVGPANRIDNDGSLIETEAIFSAGFPEVRCTGALNH